jgi:hypothetical protein
VNKSHFVALLCATLVACGQSASGHRDQSDASSTKIAEGTKTKVLPLTTNPKWLSGEKSIKTSIGELTWRSSSDEVKPCLLIEGKATLNKDDISCQNVEISVVDYSGAITVIGTSNGGGAGRLPYYNIVHIDGNGASTSKIEFGAPDDGYELGWKHEGDVFVSNSFKQDSSQAVAQLLPTGVQLVTKSISKNESAPHQMCESMKNALSTSCSESADCKDIEGGLSNLDMQWFVAAKGEPRFNYNGFMVACRSACKSHSAKLDNFESLYCKAAQ